MEILYLRRRGSKVNKQNPEASCKFCMYDTIKEKHIKLGTLQDGSTQKVRCTAPEGYFQNNYPLCAIGYRAIFNLSVKGEW